MNVRIFTALLASVPLVARTRVWVAGALLWALATAASAQIDLHAAPKPATLSTITAATTRVSEADLLVTFASNAAKYSIAGNGARQITVSFFRTTMEPRVTAPAIGAAGLLSSIRITREDDLLMLTVTAAAPILLESSEVGASALNLRFVPARAKAADMAVVRRDLPKFRDRDADEDSFEVLRLKQADVSEIAGLLSAGSSVRPNDRFAPQEPQFGIVAGSEAGGSPSYGPVPTPPSPADKGREPLAQAVDDNIAIDRRLNAIVLRGSPERIERLKRQIEQLDIAVGSVVVETGFFELDRSGAESLGLSFDNPDSQIAVATFGTGAFNRLATPGGGASVSLQAALSAQIGAGHGSMVVEPRISASSGSSAKLGTGEALPIVTSITLSGIGAVSPQVRYVNVGVRLEIAPRVASDGYVTSHVFCVTSDVTGSSNGYPTVSQREVSTSVTVRDGEPFIVGGLIQTNESASSQQPLGLAGPSPTSTTSRSKVELYVVVTPHIIKGVASEGRAAF